MAATLASDLNAVDNAFPRFCIPSCIVHFDSEIRASRTAHGETTAIYVPRTTINAKWRVSVYSAIIKDLDVTNAS